MIAGTVATGFESVAEAFRRNFEPADGDPGDLGAGLAIIVEGRTVVDLVGGHADPDRTRPWAPDTLVNIYSVGKPMAAVVALRAVERGLLDLDAPLADAWPDFDDPVGATTLRMVLSHRAGRPSVREDLHAEAYRDWQLMADALARSRPWWAPGSDHGYHVNTFGFLAGHPAVAATGKPYPDLLRRDVGEPLGADIHIALSLADQRRCAPMDLPHARTGASSAVELSPPGPSTPATEPDEMIRRAYFNPPELSGIRIANTQAWREAAVPSTNTHSTALGVARFYDALLTPGQLLPAALLNEATTIHSDGVDRVLGRPSRFGLGFMLDQPARGIGVGSRSFGHYGYGGSLGFADPDARVGFGYVINRPGDRWQNPRIGRLRAALAEALGTE